MNAAIVQRLMWKEYRFLRSFWLSTLVLAIGACASACWLLKWFHHRTPSGEDFFFLATVASCLYSLGVGSMLFATEHELSTVEFLRRLPLDARHLLVSKVATAALSLLGLNVLLWFVASFFWMITQGQVNVQSVWMIWSRGLLVELEFFAWGAVCSLLSRQPLLTITWSVGLHSLLLHILIPNLWPQNRGWGILHGYETVMLGRAIFAVLLLALLVVLSEKWIRSAEPLPVVPTWWKRISIRPRVNQERWLARKTAATLSSQLARLTWLQWRQSWRLWLALGAPVVLAGVWIWLQVLPNDDLKSLFVASTGLACLGLGVSVFHGEQVRSRFRFFAERGVNPSRVWWGHLLVSLLPLAFVITGYLWILVQTMLSRLQAGVQPQMFEVYVQPTLLWTVTFFATAQLMGLLLHNALVASAATLAMLILQGVWFGFVLGWTLFSVENQLVVGCVGLVPIPLSWFFISRWYVGHWILERRSRAVRGWLCAGFLLPWLVAACGISAFRVWEIPGGGMEPPTREELMTLSDEERQTAVMYQAIRTQVEAPESDFANAVRLHDPSQVEKALQGVSAALDKRIDDRLRESDTLIEDLMAASRRTTGAIAGDLDEQRRTVDLLFRVIVLAEAQAGDAKNIERSLELCSTAMRILEHWRHSGNCRDNVTSSDYERRVLVLLRERLATVKLTAEQYRHAATQVEAWDHPFRGFPRNYGWTYRQAIDHLRSGWLPDVTAGWEARRARNELWFRQWLPGEMLRADRLLRLEYAIARTEPWRDQSQVIGGQPVSTLLSQVTILRGRTPFVPALIGDVAAHQEWTGTTVALMRVPISARNLILRTWLELQAQKVERGDWPPALDSLQQQQQLHSDWIEYRPRGVLETRTLGPIVVQGLNDERHELQGDEPCLVYFRQAQNRMPLPETLIDAKEGEDRLAKARSLVVELLDR